MATDLLFSNYRRVVEAALAMEVRILPIRDYFASKPTGNFFVFRHDVEWGCARALEVAAIEREYGIKATYYFHGPHRKRVFRPDEMKKFIALGHEVGYHYETLDQCDGDFVAARELFIQNVSAFRSAGIAIDTVCSHGNPRKRKVGYRANYDLFVKFPEVLKQHGIIGEAYLDLVSDNVFYCSDTGARITAFECLKPIHLLNQSVTDLISVLHRGKECGIYMLTHPDYWSRSRVRALALSMAGQSLRAATRGVRRVKASLSGAVKGLR